MRAEHLQRVTEDPSYSRLSYELSENEYLGIVVVFEDGDKGKDLYTIMKLLEEAGVKNV